MSELTIAVKPYTLPDISQFIESNKTRELPSQTPIIIDERFVTLSLSKWEPVAIMCFEKVESELQKLVHEMTGKYFGRFKSSGLHQQFRYAPNLDAHLPTVVWWWTLCSMRSQRKRERRFESNAKWKHVVY